MNYYIWFLTAALLNPGQDSIAYPANATLNKPTTSDWLIFNNYHSPLQIETYLYNHSHQDPLASSFRLVDIHAANPAHCQLYFFRRQSLKIIDGKSYLSEVKIEHSHKSDWFDALEGFVKINGEKIELKARENPKVNIKIEWPEIFDYAGLDFDMMLSYTESSEYDDYYYTSEDFFVPRGTKLKIEFDYAYSYNSESPTLFKVNADRYKEYGQYFSDPIIDEPLKRPKWKMWHHYEKTIITPPNSIAISIGFAPYRPAKIYTCYIRNFKITTPHEKE